jgi:hypothetical protein
VIAWRDEGPLARAIGRTAGRHVALPPAALLAAGLVPLGLTAAIGNAPDGIATAVVAWLVSLGGLAADRDTGPLAWTTTALVRAAEYGGLLWLAALAGPRALPAAFALLCALAYRHYDLVYRPRLVSRPPAAWVGTVAGGWEGRLLVALVLVLTGAATAGYWIAAALLAVLFVGESVAAGRRIDEGDAA